MVDYLSLKGLEDVLVPSLSGVLRNVRGLFDEAQGIFSRLPHLRRALQVLGPLPRPQPEEILNFAKGRGRCLLVGCTP
jgi:hypothetical protein